MSLLIPINKSFSIQDCIYGYITLHPIAEHIVNTLQFQRMRNIKQLGVGSFVFMNANHCRFEHLIGTGYLCSLLMDRLKNECNLKDLISEQDCICVMIAGLCHDLGHGPYSHLYEKLFPNNEWKHEEMSCKMFDRMLSQNCSLAQQFIDYGLTESHVELIKALILGSKEQYHGNLLNYTLNGKNYSKIFLFEIVANKLNSIDMDKIDYLARDCYYTGMRFNTNYLRLISNINIVTQDNSFQLCYNEKILMCLNEVFHTRWDMYNKLYAHPTTICIELMLLKALKKSDKVLNFISKSFDASFFENFDDSVVYAIKTSSDENLKEPRELIKRIFTRNLFKKCGKVLLQKNCNPSLSCDYEIPTSEITKYILNCHQHNLEGRLYLILNEIGYRNGKMTHPLESVIFSEKCSGELKHAKLSTFSNLIPNNCKDEYMMLFVDFDGISKEEVTSIRKDISECFKQWCIFKGFAAP